MGEGLVFNEVLRVIEVKKDKQGLITRGRGGGKTKTFSLFGKETGLKRLGG